MTTVSEPRQDTSRDDQFFGGSLPLDLGPRRATRVYLRRLIALVVTAAIILALLSLVALVGPIGAVSTLLSIAILGAMISLKTTRHSDGPIRPPKRSHRIWAAILFTLLPTATAVSAAFAALQSGGLRPQLILLAITASLGMAFTGQVLASKADVATTVSVEQALTGVALTRTAQPLITALGDVAAATTDADRRMAADVLVNRAVGIAKTVCGRGGKMRVRTRSLFYELESDDRLKLRADEGEYGSPRPYFIAQNSENDRRVVELAKGETVLFVNDLDAAPPAHLSDPRSRPYKSYISVPVRAGMKSFGVLMIDSEMANSLTDVDVGYAILLAGLLGAGLAVAYNSTSSRPAAQADVDYINEFTETLDSVFTKDLATAAMSFHLIPEEDREFLRGTITLQAYTHIVHDLAEERARRKLRAIEGLTFGWLGRVASASLH